MVRYQFFSVDDIKVTKKLPKYCGLFVLDDMLKPLLRTYLVQYPEVDIKKVPYSTTINKKGRYRSLIE